MLSCPTVTSQRFRFDDAGRCLLADVIGETPWDDALDKLMSKLDCLGGALTCLMPPGSQSVASSAVKEVFDAISTGATPPVTARTRMTPRFDEGFVCDQMDPYRSARERDPFYQDFVRPHGLAYQATARLDQGESHAVNLVIYRAAGTGGFGPETLGSMLTCLPYLRAAAMASRARLQLESDHRAASFAARGETVIHLSQDGSVHHRSAGAVSSLAPDVTLVGRRLALQLSIDQRRLDGAVAMALREGRPGLVTVAGAAHALHLLVLPIIGRAHGLFGTTSALVVALGTKRPSQVDEGGLDLLARSTGLTRRETEVTRLVAGGTPPRRSADMLEISYATVRQHLKNVYGKLEIRTQGELMTLLSRLSTR